MKKAWAESKPQPSLGLLFRFCRIAGLFPLDLIEGNFVYSPSGLLCSAVLAVLLVLYIVAHLSVSSPRINASKLSGILNIIQLIASETCVILAVWFVMWNRQNLSQIENTLVHLQNYMFRLGVKLDDKTPYLVTVAILLTTWSVFALDCALLARSSFWEFLYVFSQYHLVSLMALTNAKMSSTAARIGSGFRSLRPALEAAVEPGRLAEWYCRLTGEAATLTAAYSMELLALFATALYSCTAEAYLAIRSLRGGTASQGVVCVFWSCVFYCICFRIIAVCVRVRGRSADFDTALYKAILKNQHGDFSFYSPAYKLYFHYCSKTRISFNALGFFSLDWHLATTMVASACTYLVLLVQYGD